MLAELRSSDSSQFTQFTMESLQDSQNNDQTVNSTQGTILNVMNVEGDSENFHSTQSYDKRACLFLDGQYDFDCSVDSDSFPVKKPGLKKQDPKDKLQQKQTEQLKNRDIDQTSAAIPLLDISNEKNNDEIDADSASNDSLIVIEADENSSETESEKKIKNTVIPETPCGYERKNSPNSSYNKERTTIQYFQAILNEMRSYILVQNKTTINIKCKNDYIKKCAPLQFFSHQYPVLFNVSPRNYLILFFES